VYCEPDSPNFQYFTGTFNGSTYKMYLMSSQVCPTGPDLEAKPPSTSDVGTSAILGLTAGSFIIVVAVGVAIVKARAIVMPRFRQSDAGYYTAAK